MFFEKCAILGLIHIPLCEGFSYWKCEILGLLSCIAYTSTKSKNKDSCEIFEKEYIDTSFQIVNRTEI